MANEIARFQCSDCDEHYFAEIVERGGRFEIGEKVPAPAKGVKVRNQPMLCGGCQGKGGGGDQLNEIMKRQRAGPYSQMGPGNDPFGLF